MNTFTWFIHSCPESLEQLSLKTWYVSIPSEQLAECLVKIEKPLSICLSQSVVTEEASFFDYAKTLSGRWRSVESLGGIERISTKLERGRALALYHKR